MKHIFFVNSHITFYMALSIQQHLKIKKKDTVIVTTLGYKSHAQERSKVIDLSKYPLIRPWLTGKFFIINLRYKLIDFHKALKESFHQVFKIVKGYFKYSEIVYTKVIDKDTPYTLYSYHYVHTLARFLASSPNCKECCLMEEGTLSYNREVWESRLSINTYVEGSIKRYHKNKLNKFNHFLRFLFRIYSFIPREPARSYGIHEDGFPDNKIFSKTVIPFYNDTSLDLKYIPNNATLFFMESMFDKDFFESNSLFFERLKTVFGRIPGKKIYLKFHMINASYTREQTLEALAGAGKAVKVIEDSIPSEQIFLQKNDLKIYALRSSVLFYAGIFKAGKVFALEDVFADLLKRNRGLAPNLRKLLERQATFLKPLSFE